MKKCIGWIFRVLCVFFGLNFVWCIFSAMWETLTGNITVGIFSMFLITIVWGIPMGLTLWISMILLDKKVKEEETK